jgi:hypothetical protein
LISLSFSTEAADEALRFAFRDTGDPALKSIQNEKEQGNCPAQN